MSFIHKIQVGFTDSIKQACLFNRDVLKEKEKELREVIIGDNNAHRFSVELLDESLWTHDKKIENK